MILGFSAAAFVFLLWLFYYRGVQNGDPVGLAFLPAVNAGLNALSATCITVGIVAIKTGRKRLHMGLMISAVVLSTIFLVSYITYHNLHGDTKFASEGPIRTFY